MTPEQIEKVRAQLGAYVLATAPTHCKDSSFFLEQRRALLEPGWLARAEHDAAEIERLRLQLDAARAVSSAHENVSLRRLSEIADLESRLAAQVPDERHVPAETAAMSQFNNGWNACRAAMLATHKESKP